MYENQNDKDIVAQLQEKVLPINAIKKTDGSEIITIDVRVIRGKMLAYLNNLPSVSTQRPAWNYGQCGDVFNGGAGTVNDCPSSIWAYTVGSPLDGVAVNLDVMFNGIKDRFEINTITANYSMQPIVAPMVNKVFKDVRNFINGRPVTSIPENDEQMRTFNESFQDAFTPLAVSYTHLTLPTICSV